MLVGCGRKVWGLPSKIDILLYILYRVQFSFYSVQSGYGTVKTVGWRGLGVGAAPPLQQKRNFAIYIIPR